MPVGNLHEHDTQTVAIVGFLGTGDGIGGGAAAATVHVVVGVLGKWFYLCFGGVWPGVSEARNQGVQSYVVGLVISGCKVYLSGGG